MSGGDLIRAGRRVIPAVALGAIVVAALVVPMSLDEMPVGGSWQGVRAGEEATGRTTPTAYGDCGPGALPETGLQGQVPGSDQVSGRSALGYRCNLRLVGENDIELRGANFQLAWYRDCAYVGIVGNQLSQGRPSPPSHPLDGVAVLDASDPRRPRMERVVRSEVGRTQHEGLEVNAERGMLVVQTGGILARWIEIYDVSDDCRRPVFRGRYDAGKAMYHGLRISDDGRTVYASEPFGTSAVGEILHVLDVSDMSRPRLLTTWDPTDEGRQPFGIHDLEVSPDGRRAYLGVQPYSSEPGVLVAGPPSSAAEPSLLVLDTTDIQERRPEPDPEIVGDLALPNFGHAVQRARIDGRPYLFVGGETPFAGVDNCPWAWAHVVDLSDERHPREVSQIKLEVNELANCPQVAGDNAVYSIHYVGVDDERDTSTVFYTYYTGGVRAFDVRDPTRPREIAYYHPPPKADTVFEPLPINAGDTQTPAWDSVTSVVRYRPELGHLWMASIAGGLQILEPVGRARDVIPLRPTELRLTRRCIGDGRLRMNLDGEDADRVRDVNFKFDRRLVARDTRAPFEGVAARRALRRTQARRLRAVAYPEDRPPGERVILSRSLPRCGR